MKRNAGFTLIEVMVSMVVLSILLGGIAGILFRSESFLSMQSKEADLDFSGRRALTAISEQIRQAYSDSILPAVLENSSSIQFERVIDYEAGVVELGPVTLLSKQLAAGEIENGIDDNGDGRSDEGALLYSDADGVSRFIAGDVLAVRFDSIDGGITATLTIGKLSREGQLLQQTFTQSVHIRN